MWKSVKLLGGMTVLIASVLLFSCSNPAGGGGSDNGGPTILTNRYEVVRYGTLSGARGAAGNESEFSGRLVDSGRAYDESAWHFIYYMGFIRSKPIAFRTNYLYNGQTPITISYDRNWSDSTTITNGKQQATSHTWNISNTFTMGLDVTASGGFKPFGSLEVKASLSNAFTAGYGGSISTTETLETAKSKIEGSNDTISATIGNNNELPGRYRYALMGTSDVFLRVKVDPSTRKILSQEIVYMAREETYGWGIEFTPFDLFERTGGGGQFEPRDDDFVYKADDRPGGILVGPPVPCPGVCGKFTENCECPPETTYRVDLVLNTGPRWGGAENKRGDNNINSSNNRATDWEFRVTAMSLEDPRGNGTFQTLRVTVEYNVMEVWSDHTHLQVTRTHDFILSEHGVMAARELVGADIDGITTGRQTGRIAGENHFWNQIWHIPPETNPFGQPHTAGDAFVRTWPFSLPIAVHASPASPQMNLAPIEAWDSGPIRGLTLRIDGSGGDLGNIGYNASFRASVMADIQNVGIEL